MVGGRPKQVPPIAFEIEEDSHLTVRLKPWRRYEVHVIAHEASKCRVEIVHPKKEADSPSELPSYGTLLLGSIGTREQNPRDCSGWAHHNPPLRAAIICFRRLIFDKLELQDVHEEVACEIVLANNEGDELKMCHTPVG